MQGLVMTEAIRELFVALDKARGDTVRVEAALLAQIDGKVLVPREWRGGKFVTVDRGALFKFLTDICDAEGS